ncbi:MAG TPA: hypothetical protein VHF88_01175 [Thermoleophilaceae bacterium]|nr:hypothetical protein [Thermoleophilaceae bacterium]
MALRNRTLVACALSLALAGGLAACGSDHEALGVEEPAREGLAIDIGGLDYNVFITRELNLAITPDKDYYEGPPPEPGHNLFGVFIQVCNLGEETLPSAEEFKVTDNQGVEFEPIDLPEDNAFAYNPRELAPEQCIPEDGSVAQQGPTAGSMLLFDFPLENTENRPLELEITSPATAEHESETKRFLLDL